MDKHLTPEQLKSFTDKAKEHNRTNEEHFLAVFLGERPTRELPTIGQNAAESEEAYQ